MAENNVSHFQQEIDSRRTKNRENVPCSTTIFEGNMRDQTKATRLVFSPKTRAKNVGKSDENGKPKSFLKESKSKSDDSSSTSSVSLEGKDKRKSLHVLQPSADGHKLLVGGQSARKTKSKSQQKNIFSSTQKKLKHYLTKSTDVETQSSSSDVESTTTSVTEKSEIPSSSDEAYALMVQDRAPEKYWELVAEERRKALEETLDENMKLYEMIETLKAENDALREKCNNTEYFATMYKISKDDTREDSSDS